MRKTLAYFLSIFTLFTLGLTILHPSFRALSDWLGPLLGSHIYSLFTLLYLLVADPLRYPLVAMVWIFTGLLIGIISGKKLGAALTALIVWLTTIPLILSTVAGIYFNLDSKGLFTSEIYNVISLVPVIPDQLTLGSFLEVPIFSELALTLLEIAPTMSEATDPTNIILNIITPYAFSFALKPVILIICAILGAVISASLVGLLRNIMPNRKTMLTLLTITALALQATPVNALPNLNDGIYAEIIGGYVEEQNRVIMAELLLGNQIEYVSMDTPEATGLVASIIITHEIYEPALLYSLPIEGLTDILNFRKLAPSTFAVNIYLGDDIAGIESKSNEAIETVENELGIDLVYGITTPLPFEEGQETSMPKMSAAIYYSQNTIDETTANMLNIFSSEAGFHDYFKTILTTGEPQDLELYATGIIYLETLQEMLQMPDLPTEYQDEYQTLIESSYSFAAGVQLKADAAEPDVTGYIFDLGETLGVDSVPSYAPSSDASFIIMGRSNKTGITEPLDPTIFVKSSFPEDSIELSLLTMFLQDMGSIAITGGTPTSQDTQIIIPEIHPPEITLTKNIESTGDQLEITLTATNNGDTPVIDLQLIDTFPRKYGKLLTGSGESTFTSLSPGETMTHTYSILAKNPGTYTDVPAVLHFTSEDVPSSTASNINPGIEKNPSTVLMLADSYQAITGVLDLVLEGNGHLLSYAILGFILFIAVIDLVKYTRSRNDAQPVAEVAPGVPPESPEDNSEDLL